jgi:hypothetical protein
MPTPLMTPTRLAALRAQSEASMPDTAQRQVLTTVRSSGGVEAQTYTVSGGPVPCRYRPLSHDERVRDDQVTAEAGGLLVLPAGTATIPTDRWAVTFADGSGTITLNVIGVGGPRTYEMHRAVEVTEVPIPVPP